MRAFVPRIHPRVADGFDHCGVVPLIRVGIEQQHMGSAYSIRGSASFEFIVAMGLNPITAESNTWSLV